MPMCFFGSWDILYHYAICGIILFAFRRVSPKYLLVAAGICLLLMTARENRDLYKQKGIIDRGEIAATIDTSTTKLTEKQKADLNGMNEIKESSDPTAKKKKLEKELAGIRGSYRQLYEVRSEMAEEGETKGMYEFLIWDVLLFMFMGAWRFSKWEYYREKLRPAFMPGWLYWDWLSGYRSHIYLSPTM